MFEFSKTFCQIRTRSICRSLRTDRSLFLSIGSDTIGHYHWIAILKWLYVHQLLIKAHCNWQSSGADRNVAYLGWSIYGIYTSLWLRKHLLNLVIVVCSRLLAVGIGVIVHFFCPPLFLPYTSSVIFLLLQMQKPS
jgi:hypothetical protein